MIWFSLFHRDGKTLAAGGTAHDVIPRDAGEAQGAFAMRALAVDVRFSVANAECLTAEGHEELAPKPSKGGVFLLPFVNVTRKKAEECVPEGKKIQGKENVAQDAMRAEKSAKEDKDQGEDKGDVVEGVGSVSAHKKAGKSEAEAAGVWIAHKDLVICALWARDMPTLSA